MQAHGTGRKFNAGRKFGLEVMLRGLIKCPKGMEKLGPGPIIQIFRFNYSSTYSSCQCQNAHCGWK